MAGGDKSARLIPARCDSRKCELNIPPRRTKKGKKKRIKFRQTERFERHEKVMGKLVDFPPSIKPARSIKL
jgi:hypothetical protein